MKISQYKLLVDNPPVLTVKPGAREVVVTLVSSMCDNKSTLILKKNADGDFKVSLLNESFKNIQTKSDHIDIEWTADEGKWDEVIDMINSGTSKISLIRSR